MSYDSFFLILSFCDVASSSVAGCVTDKRLVTPTPHSTLTDTQLWQFICPPTHRWRRKIIIDYYLSNSFGFVFGAFRRNSLCKILILIKNLVDVFFLLICIQNS